MRFGAHSASVHHQDTLLRLRHALQRFDPDHPEPARARSMTLSELQNLLGPGSGPCMLLMLATLSGLPLVGIGNLVCLAVLALAVAVLLEREVVSLPKRLASFSLNQRWAPRCLKALVWIYSTAGQWLRPRWHLLVHRQLRLWWAVWMVGMVVMILLPLPLVNLLPALSLLLLSLGWLFRDGLAMVLATAVGAVGLGYALSLWHLLVLGWQQVLSWF